MKFINQKGKILANMIQAQPFCIELEIENSSAITFGGGVIHKATLKGSSGFGLMNRIPFDDFKIKSIASQAKLIIRSNYFMTYYSEACFVEIDLLADDGKDIDVSTPYPLKSDPLSKMGKPNQFIKSCFVYSRETISNNRIACITTFLAIIATGASVLALWISFNDRQDTLRDAREAKILKLYSDQVELSAKTNKELSNQLEINHRINIDLEEQKKQSNITQEKLKDLEIKFNKFPTNHTKKKKLK